MVSKITIPPTQNEVIDKINELVDDKQDTLVSGTNIKTVNNTSLLGSGNISVGTVTSVNNTSPVNGNVTLSIPAAQVNSDWNASSGVAQILNKPSLATVATSGSYNDLSNKPTIPTVNNATLTITQGGTTKGTFTANASSNVTIDLDSGGGASRNIGEIVQSTIPLTDAGLHLLDGGVIQRGSYADFVDYIAGLVSTYPDLFTTEANWQSAVTTYGVCGKFVYDSVNNTVRLPKITGFTEGTTDLTALGDLVEAGLPNITGSSTYSGNSYGLVTSGAYTEGAFYIGSTSRVYSWASAASANVGRDLLFDASRSSSIYGNSTTVQPQTIKVLYYICIATSTKTQIQVDIDEIATDLNGKADVDLSNINPTQTVKNTIVGWGMPDYNSKVTIATTTYEAPSDGYVWYRNNAIQAMTVTVGGIEWYTGTIAGTSGTAMVPISKGETSVASTLSSVVAYFIPLKGVS